MKKTSLLAGLVALGAVATLVLAADTGGMEEQGLVTSEFQITGMTCGGCAASIKMTIKKLDGVTKVEASYENGDASVTYDPDKVTVEQIKAAVKKLGFEAEQKKPQQPASSSHGSAASEP